MKAEAQAGFSTPTYAYARNNPVRYFDDDGLKAKSCKERCKERKIDRLMRCDLAGRPLDECAKDAASEFGGCMDNCEDKPPEGPFPYRPKDQRKLPACGR